MKKYISRYLKVYFKFHYFCKFIPRKCDQIIDHSIIPLIEKFDNIFSSNISIIVFPKYSVLK